LLQAIKIDEHQFDVPGKSQNCYVPQHSSIEQVGERLCLHNAGLGQSLRHISDNVQNHLYHLNEEVMRHFDNTKLFDQYAIQHLVFIQGNN
jgi:hypothetical protein